MLKKTYSTDTDMPHHGHWLTRDRLITYPRILLALYLVIGAIWLALSSHGLDPFGKKPIGADFITFWAASRLALTGDPVAAYDAATFIETLRAMMPGIEIGGPWLYPPTFYLLVLPLALLPFLWSYALFIGSTLAVYLLAVRKVFAPPHSFPLLLAFPGVFVNAVNGQNGFLTAALITAALLSLRAHPVRAGVLIGVLTIKPQLGLLLPLVLLSGGYWRALISATVTTLALLLLSVSVIGVGTLTAFVHMLPTASQWVADNALPLAKMPTFFAFARLLGAPLPLAWGLFGGVALSVAVSVVWVWRQAIDFSLKAAALVIGALLTTPYLFDYDLTWLAPALAWFASYGMRCGWLRGEREVLVVVWLLPFLVPMIPQLVSIQAAPFVVLAFFLVILRRALTSNPLNDNHVPVRNALIANPNENQQTA